MMGSERRQRILDLALSLGALAYGDFVLSSGARSSYYFDGRLLTLDPEGAYLIGQELLQQALASGAGAIGGPTLGADPIVASVVVASFLEGRPVRGFLVRAEPKKHGARRLIEGPLEPGSRAVIVDDVCTTGGSLFRAIAAAEEAGCQVVHVAAVLDRREGGSQELLRRGYPFTALLEAAPEGGVKVVGASEEHP
jgi:orotate phosphoribosyltransferase